MPKSDLSLPTLTSPATMRDEIAKFHALFNADNWSASGSEWTSTSSGTTYTYPKEGFEGVGEENLYNQLATATAIYRLTASEINTINTNLSALLLNTTTKDSLIRACVKRDISGVIQYKSSTSVENNSVVSVLGTIPTLVKTISLNVSQINFIKIIYELSDNAYDRYNTITVKEHSSGNTIYTDTHRTGVNYPSYDTVIGYADVTNYSDTIVLDIYLNSDNSGITVYNRNFKIYGNDTQLNFTTVV